MIIDRSERTDEYGERLVIVVCPLCGASRGEDYESYATHFATHEWADLGLGKVHNPPTDAERRRAAP